MSVHDAGVLLAHLERRSGDPALITCDGELTFADLADEVERMTVSLGGGRRLVAVAAANTVSCLTAYLACLRAGHVVLMCPPCRVESLADTYRADTLVTATGVERRHRRPAHDLHPDLALLLSTSGSTGSPKLVRLSHRNLAANATAVVTSLAVRPGDRAVTTLSPAYSYGLSVINSHLSAGAALVLTESSVTDDEFWALSRRSGVTSLAAVPFLFDLLDRRGFRGTEIPSLRLVTCAGGALAPATARRYAALGARCGWQIALMYGATEATARMACLPPQLTEQHPDSVGYPVAGGSFRVVDPDADGVGSLYYRGPNVMMGYAHSASDLGRGPESQELRTGDRGRVGPDGLVHIVGREDRFAKIFGLRVDLGDVDAALRDAGVEAWCVARTRDIAVVTSTRDAERVRRIAAEAASLPPHAVRTVTVDHVPRTDSGKVDGAAVARLVADCLEPATSVPPTAGTAVSRLCHAYAAVLDRPVAPTASFVSLRGDSLSYVAVSAGVEQVMGFLPRDWHLMSIDELAALADPAGARLPGRQVETGVLLRALAIVAIVGSHAGAMDLRGGAHVLVALVGVNFARFHLDPGPGDLTARLARMMRAVATLVLPALLWLALLVVVTGTYTWGVVGATWLTHPTTDTPDWRYWFVAALLWLLLPAALLVRIPAVEAARRRSPFAVPLVAAVAAWVAAAALVPDARPSELFAPLAVAWLLLLGWAVAAITTRRQAVVVSAVVVVLAPLTFEGPRMWVIPAALLMLVWVRTMRIPARLVPAVVAVAEASLLVYLTHWQVLEVLTGWPALLVSVAVGVLVQRAWSRRRRAPLPARTMAARGGVVRRSTPPQAAVVAP